MFFVEDLLPPEQVAWYKEVRQVCATPQAVGELFTNSAEYYPLIADRVINFIRTRVTAIGGITPAKKTSRICARRSGLRRLSRKVVRTIR